MSKLMAQWKNCCFCSITEQNSGGRISPDAYINALETRYLLAKAFALKCDNCIKYVSNCIYCANSLQINKQCLQHNSRVDHRICLNCCIECFKIKLNYNFK